MFWRFNYNFMTSNSIHKKIWFFNMSFSSCLDYLLSLQRREFIGNNSDFPIISLPDAVNFFRSHMLIPSAKWTILQVFFFYLFLFFLFIIKWPFCSFCRKYSPILCCKILPYSGHLVSS